MNHSEMRKFYNLFFFKSSELSLGVRIFFSSVFGLYFTSWIRIQEAKILRIQRIRILSTVELWYFLLFSTSEHLFFVKLNIDDKKVRRFKDIFSYKYIWFLLQASRNLSLGDWGPIGSAVSFIGKKRQAKFIHRFQNGIIKSSLGPFSTTKAN